LGGRVQLAFRHPLREWEGEGRRAAIHGSALFERRLLSRSGGLVVYMDSGLEESLWYARSSIIGTCDTDLYMLETGFRRTAE
jgi:hypothetical protein